jgi:CD2 antigen cytoplasmic tail-binding protein 2
MSVASQLLVSSDPTLCRPKVKKHKTDETDMHVDKSAHRQTSDIDQITHLASTLMSLGDTDIYSKAYEQLVRSVRSSGQVDPSWDPPSADVKYEYKWVVSDDGGQTFGPFSEEEMNAWYKAAYFGPMGEKVKVRPLGGDWGDWDDTIT